MTAIGRGLRALHERLPVRRCPFSWTAEQRVSRARSIPQDRRSWHEEHRALTAQEALTKLGLYRGNIDGKIGPAMREAVHAYQIKAGIQPADGFLTSPLVQRLKSAAGL